MKQLADFPEFVAARAKLDAVQARHHAVVAERDALLATIEGARDRTESLSDQAARLLNGDDAIVADIDTLRERYSRAGRQVGLLGEVVRLARQRLEDERATASREICTEARPQFSALVLAELQAAHDLLVAQAARRAFWQTMDDGGVLMATLPQVAPLVKGSLHDPSTTLWQLVDDAVRLGYIAAGELTQPERAPGRDGPLNRPGLRLLAAGPEGVGTVEVQRDGTARPVPGRWTPTPPAANGWDDAA